jgi:hypothetical protein
MRRKTHPDFGPRIGVRGTRLERRDVSSLELDDTFPCSASFSRLACRRLARPRADGGLLGRTLNRQLGSLAVLAWLLGSQVANGQADPQALTPEVDALLIQMEAAGTALRDLRADITLTVRELDEEDEDEVLVYLGEALLLRSPDRSRTQVRLDSWRDGEVVNTGDRRWYAFDGVFLVEAREKEQRRVRKQVVGEGQHIDPFRLGEGPFPLPFGQTRLDMIKQFLVQKGPQEGDGGPHLICVPRPESDLARRYDRIDLFLSAVPNRSGLTEKIVLQDRKDRQEKTIEFKSIRINGGLGDKDLDLPLETKSWTELEEPFPQD